MPIASVPPATPPRPSPGALPPALVLLHPRPLAAVGDQFHDVDPRRLGLAVLGASLLALALGINLLPHPAWRTQAGANALQGGRSFATVACMGCHAIGSTATSMAPEPGAAPTFQWIARSHPDYLDGFLLRPSGAHALVVGSDAAGLRALFADLGRIR